MLKVPFRPTRPAIITFIVLLAWVIFCLTQFGAGLEGRSLVLVGTALILWLSELVPAFVPTLFLIGGSLALLRHEGAAFSAGRLFQKMADPVLGLFFCGMCLGLLLRHQKIDQLIASYTLRLSKGLLRRNLRYAMFVTAFLAMWTTNSTAMAIALPAFGGILTPLMQDRPQQARAYLIALAMAANFGGMATPIGTAPNAIAIAELKPFLQIDFIEWVGLMLPLSLILLVLSDLLIAQVFDIKSTLHLPLLSEGQAPSLDRRSHAWPLSLFLGTIALWLTEPWHGLPPLATGFVVAGLCFVTKLIPAQALKDIDWDVLILIAGGLLLGFLLEESGWMQRLALALQAGSWSQDVQIALFIALAAFSSAISSNTATAILIIPLVLKLSSAEPYAAIAVAAACSMGVPFTISTPANALIAGRYAVSNRDLAKVGLPLAVAGCILLALTSEKVVTYLLGE